MLSPELAAAFYCTSYWVELSAGDVAIRVGEPTPVLDDWTSELGCECWAFLTAFNPQARLLTDSENEARQGMLEAELQALGLTFARGRSVSDDGQWPPEISSCVAGIAVQQAVDLARKFEQLAIVVGRVGGLATLVVV